MGVPRREREVPGLYFLGSGLVLATLFEPTVDGPPPLAQMR
ncbi:MAG: hypothetical protein WKF78_12210 [Candidatus Limnocylindrales bacterium]